MATLRRPVKGVPDTGPKMTDDEINKAVIDYSSGYKPKPTGQTKSQKIVHRMFSEVKNEIRPQKQKVAIALNKARAAGAHIPKARPRGK